MKIMHTGLALAVLAASLVISHGAASAADAAKGKILFTEKYGCFQCHGTVGQGGNAGPKLAPDPMPFEALANFVRTTRPADAALSGSGAAERGPGGHLCLPAVGPGGARLQDDSDPQQLRVVARTRPRPGTLPGLFRAPRNDGQGHKSSTSRSLLQPAQQIMTRLFSACSSSVRMASRCSGMPEITRCSQAPQIPSSQE